MNSLQRGIIDLIYTALTKEPITLPSDFDWDAACSLGANHQILTMLYYGARNAGVTLPQAWRERLEYAAIQGVFRDQNQLYELERIRTCFLENGIEFMLLKGALLKVLYPQTDMRPMGDADILIKTAQYDKIVPLMEQLGYTAELESDHELVWQKPGALYLELHKRLIPSYNKDYCAYFGDGWTLARSTDTTEYVMGDEDQFIYLFTHYAKHYRDGGIGIRHLVDLHVYRQAKSSLDWAYIDQELEKLQLLTFCRNSMATLDVWFNGASDTPMSDFITEHIFGSGPFGTKEKSIMADALKVSKTVEKENVQKQKRWKVFFPSFAAMSNAYPWASKSRLLLPFAWVYRWVVVLIFRRESIEIQRKQIGSLTVENITAYQDELNYVGLDFNFEE